jgi:hypothetical protein
MLFSDQTTTNLEFERKYIVMICCDMSENASSVVLVVSLLILAMGVERVISKSVSTEGNRRTHTSTQMVRILVVVVVVVHPVPCGHAECHSQNTARMWAARDTTRTRPVY